MKLRPAVERGHADYGWLKARYTFSFGDYFDPGWMGWRCLRVMNEDRIGGHTGFPSHPHREMEIVTIMLSGSLAHEDSTGSSGVIQKDEVQVMSAGRGIVHSEKNADEEKAHLYQIWLQPRDRDIEPRYDQRKFHEASRRGKWQLLVSGDPKDEALYICQDATIQRRIFTSGESDTVAIQPNRGHWIQVISGKIQVGDQKLQTSDGISIENDTSYLVTADAESDILLFDLP